MATTSTLIITPTPTISPTPDIASTLDGSAFLNAIVASATNLDFAMLVKLLIFWVGVAWLLTVIWVFKDALSRYDNVYMPFIWVIIILPFNLLGVFAYVILRPVEYVTEKKQERVDLKLVAGESLRFIECPNCNAINDRDGGFCIECGAKLFSTCPKCGKQVWLDWMYCKHCGVVLSDEIFDLDFSDNKLGDKLSNKSGNKRANHVVNKHGAEKRVMSSVVSDAEYDKEHVKNQSTGFIASVFSSIKDFCRLVLHGIKVFAIGVKDFFVFVYIVVTDAIYIIIDSILFVLLAPFRWVQGLFEKDEDIKDSKEQHIASSKKSKSTKRSGSTKKKSK